MKKFLDKYDTVIFDMDGVITSEENYWNSAALTVSEFLSSDKYNGGKKINVAKMSAEVKSIRETVFAKNRLIAALKGRGVNSNWDLGYVTALISIILSSDDSGKILEYAEGLSDNILDEYDSLSSAAARALGTGREYTARNGKMWQDMHYCFQEWFLGDELFYKQYGRKPKEPGKPGLVNSEMPIIPMYSLNLILGELSKTKRICTGTGRPAAEILSPLNQWGVLKYFAPDGLCNYDNVSAAEAKTGLTLTKPHPYMFLKALYGTGYDDGRLLSGDYDKTKISKTLVIGDAGADILAAKAMGADFCAVLTGIDGSAARTYFEELNAEYILNSAADLL